MEMKNIHKKVFVGMSGGVDSSVTAMILQDQGYDVTGVYMKNWSEDLPGFPCPWRDDYLDAKRVAVQLGIEFKLYDFENDYKQKVVDYMVSEYKAGKTPNPDIMCNQEVKFKLFLKTALEDGADFIATGHYAITRNGSLYRAKDENKDQTYFLYRVDSSALEKVIFPLGDLTKPEVRQLAEKNHLATASKKESMGICFVGKVGIKDFLSRYIDDKPGEIINQKGQRVGRHDGAIFYTIGQRHGLDVGGGLPYYVTAKDINKNIVFVTTDIDDKKLWQDELVLTDTHWINNPPNQDDILTVRIRHRGPLEQIEKLIIQNDSVSLKLNKPVRSACPGQSAVIYDQDRVVGGGIIT